MKGFVILVAIVVARAVATPSTEWSIERAVVVGLKNDTLAVDSIIVVRAEGEALRIEAWRPPDGDPDTVMIDIDVFAADGSKLAKVISTGPAEAFRKELVIPRGESRRYAVFTESFSITRFGWYVAKGQLRGLSAAGRTLDLPLREIRFHVETLGPKKPNKAPEPTPGSVTPRAND